MSTYEVLNSRRCGRASQVRMRDLDSGVAWVAFVDGDLNPGDICTRTDDGRFVRLATERKDPK